MKLSDNLKFIRKENNLSQEQLAEKLGVSRQAVSKWESGQSYPEMDKVLLICKLFNYNIDELMNENVKEVNENKESKSTVNKYIDDFFGYITKTVNMISSMSFKQKLKCFVEQIIVVIILVLVFSVFSSIIIGCLNNMLDGFVVNAFPVTSAIAILESIYFIFVFILAVAIFLHIFKIRYLDYYEIVKENKDTDEIDKDSEEKIAQKDADSNDNKNNYKEKLFNKKEKIVIRDPEHSEAKFLNAIVKSVILFIKFIVACIAVMFAFTFVALIVALVLCFLFVKTGLVFIGAILCVVSMIIANFIVLELCYNFIVDKKVHKTRTGICLLIALILGGASIGFMFIGITEFDFIQDESILTQENKFHFEMTENLSINFWNNIEYVEKDIENVEIVIKHSDYCSIDNINVENDTIDIWRYLNQDKAFDAIRQTIKDINNKKINDYSQIKVYVYASQENINKLKVNTENKRKQAMENEISYLEDKIDSLEIQIESLEEEIYEKDIIIDDLRNEY